MEVLLALLAGAVLFWLWAACGGWLLTRLLPNARQNRLLFLATSPALGSLVFALLALLLSLPGWCLPWVCRTLTLLGLVAFPPKRVDLPPPVWLLAGVAALGALAPTTHVDTQSYHYPLPWRYLQHGGLHWTGLGVFDGVFHLFHLMLVWPLGLAGELCANLLGPLFLAVTGLALASFQPGSRLPWLLLASSPLLVIQSSGGLPELPAVAMALLSLAWWQRGLGPNASASLSLAAFFCGAAVSMRLNLAPLAVALALATLIAGGGWRAALKPLVATGLCCLPWLSFNLWHTGHPLYPIGPRWEIKDLRSHPTSAPRSTAPAQLPALAAPQGLPWNLLLPLAPDASPRRWQDTLSPLLVAGCVFALGRSPGPLLWPGLIYLVLLVPLRIHDLRYGAPGGVWLLPLALLGWGRPRALWKQSLLLLGLAVGGLVSWSTLPPRLLPLLGEHWRHDYLSRRLEVYQAYRWLAGTHYRKVLLTDIRGWHCPRPWCGYIQDDLSRAAQPYQERSLAGIHHALEQRHCDLVLLNLHRQEVRQAVESTEHPERWLEKNDGQFREMRMRMLWHLIRRGKVVYSQGGVMAIEWPGPVEHP